MLKEFIVVYYIQDYIDCEFVFTQGGIMFFCGGRFNYLLKSAFTLLYEKFVYMLAYCLE